MRALTATVSKLKEFEQMTVAKCPNCGHFIHGCAVRERNEENSPLLLSVFHLCGLPRERKPNQTLEALCQLGGK